jgi:hypothetical protein
MKLDLYPKAGFCLFLIILISFTSVKAQDCSALNGTYTTTESRCMATGTVTVSASGGSGNYNYKAVGPVSTPFTSSNIISGLPAGTYTVTIKDVLSGCLRNISNVVIGGSYTDPRFQLSQTDITCIGATDGTITVTNLDFGRAPFTFTIVAPSASGIGTSNSTGIFTNLSAGDYSIRLTDSCGGMQTRRISIQNYNWWIENKTVTTSCSNVNVNITVKDNKGNTNQATSVFTGYQYGIVRSNGDTVWSSSYNFSAFKGNLRSLGIVVKDNCGNIQTSSWTQSNIPAVAAAVTTGNFQCASFDATVTGQANLTSPQYCLYNTSFIQLSCNSTGSFPGLAYGSYFIMIRDNCYDTTIFRSVSASLPTPTANATVTISDTTCTTFTASITGQQYLSNATYRLYDQNNVLIATNTTGVFTGITGYGDYCIRITDNCTGTILNRCFTAVPPIPGMGNISVSTYGCTTFNANVGGAVNLTSPSFCIYDENDVLIACNSDGVFNGLPYGTYCVKMTNTCYDTTITRCITVGRQIPSLGASVNISGRTCTGFNATVTSPVNLRNPYYCVYDAANVLVACDSSGSFTNLPYGSYTMRMTNNTACYDTVIVRTFASTRPVPAGGSVNISNRTCTGFRATSSGTSNLTSPTYYVYDQSNVLVAQNTLGWFDLPYGSYRMEIVNTCYDTTIVRNFSAAALPTDINVTASATCNIGFANLQVSFAAGVAPFTVEVYNPGGMLVRTVNSATSPVAVNSLPGLPAGMRYKVVGTDNCGGKDSSEVLPNASWLNKSILTNSKCPSGQWQTGSGDLQISSSSSFGAVTPVIIKKNGVATTINYSSGSSGNYTFSNMEPADYIIEYSIPTCSNKVYDTFSLAQYAYPTLQQSAAYQCDNNSFSVSAAVTGGVGPFSYEVIGSFPASPSIIAAPQASPVFSINNGTIYSLVRLRALDACGNATLNDVSILPLANTVVSTSADCYYNEVVLSVDTIPNASYEWFRVANPGDTVLVASSQHHTIPFFLPSDTGVYISKISVNSGCLTKYSYFHLVQVCPEILSVKVNLTGRQVMDDVQLDWFAGNEADVKEYYIERSGDKNSGYQTIGKVISKQKDNTRYVFSDNEPLNDVSYYRIRIVGRDNKSTYSNVITIRRGTQGAISVFPNPVKSTMNVSFSGSQNQSYKLSIYNAAGQAVYETLHKGGQSTFQYHRPSTVKPGIYVLRVVNTLTGELSSHKVLFE